MKQSNSWLSGLWRAADMASRSASPASNDDERHAVVSNPPSPTQLTGLVAAEAKSHRRQHSDQSRFARPAKKNVRRARVVEPETDEEYTGSEDWRRDCRAVAVLGQGSFGRVHLVTFQGGKFALKSVAVASLTTPKKREHARSERVALALLRGHPNILRMHAAWTAPGALHLATECAWGGELFRHLQRRKRFAAAETRFIIAELAAALCHAHKHKVAYRDVKPENVLFGGTGHVLLADFGLSKIVSIDEKDFPTKGCISLCGTPEYMAPEVLDRAPYGGSVDWWALGMLSAELLTGLPPWYTEDRVELFRRIRRAPLEPRHLVCRDPRARRDPLQRDTALLVERLLRRDALQRPSDADIKNDRYFAFCGGLEDLPTMEPPFNPSSSDADPGPAFHDRVSNERAPSRRRCAPLSEVAAVARNFEASDSVSMTADAVALDVAAAAAPPPPPPDGAPGSPGVPSPQFSGWTYP